MRASSYPGVKPLLIARYGVAACLLMLAAGCAMVGTQKTDQGSTAPTIARQYRDNLQLTGRLSVFYRHQDREESLHGSFTWTQDARDIHVALLSPLGQTLAMVDILPGSATLTQSGKPPMRATDVNSLTQQALGWPLPVAGLREWLQGFGRDASGKPFIAHPSRDTRRFVSQDGWSVSYRQWQDDDADTTLNRPKRIDLARETIEGGPVAIRIVIDNWQSH